MTKTVQQIINDIDVRMPNGVSLDSKIEWLNEALKATYHAIGEDNIAETLTVSGQPFYYLYDTLNNVDRIEYRQITAVTVNGQEYKPAFMHDQLSGYRYYKVDRDYFGIYPIPTQSDLKILIYYKHRPEEIKVDNLNAIPMVDEDYYELIKYGVMYRIAEAEQDIPSRNNYSNQYNEMLKNAERDMNDNFSTYPQVEDVMPRAGYGYYGRRRTAAEVISDGI